MAVIRWTPRNELWEPFTNLADIQGEMNRLFDSSLRRYSGRTAGDGGFLPACDVVEEKDHLFVQVDLPGLRKEDVSVTLQEGVLTIKGERRAEAAGKEAAGKEAAWYLRERAAGSFTRTMELPVAVDAGKIEAHFRDGVLSVKLPKAEAAKPKQIEVKVA
jgi:HSP20 family protein